MKGLLAALALVAASVVSSAAQTATTGRVPSPRPAAAPPRATSVRVSVRDQAGESLTGVRLVVSGTASGEYTTGAAGTAILPIPKAGVVRVRCEREGYVTLEREFTVGNGVWNPIDVVLNEAIAPPPPEPPAKPAPEPSPAATAPSGPPMAMSIPDFIDKNFIGRDPLKESILACKPMETVRLLQMRDNVAAHVHEHVDEVIYVIAGEGTIRIAELGNPVRAGSLVFVPNGNGHAIEPKGKNPLIVVSTLVGSSCDHPRTTP